MNKQLTPKVVLIIVLIVLAFITVYPPDQKLKRGIDLDGGVSMIFQIGKIIRKKKFVPSAK